MRVVMAWCMVAGLGARAGAEPPRRVNLLTSVPATIAVSSTVDNRAILPEHIVDGRLDTAWNSRTNQLIGAWVGFRVPADAQVDAIKLTVGFTRKDPRLGDLFTMNPRIKAVRVLHDGKTVAEQALDPELRTLQDIAIHGGGGDYKIEIVDIVPGSKKTWREISISELEVWGTPGAGGAKPQRPVVRVGSLDPPPALTRDECVKAMFPRARGDRIDVGPDADAIVHFEAVALGGDVDICRIDHRAAGADDGVAELAAVKRTPRLTVVARPPGLPIASQGGAATGGMGEEKTVALSAFPLTTREAALLVDVTEHSFGPMADDGKTTSTLYRLLGGAIVPVLTFETSWRSGESGDADRCTLQPPALGASIPGLAVECTMEHSRYPGNPDDKDRTETRIERYRWDGTSYQKQ